MKNPRNAAAVILLRTGTSGGFETLLIRRFPEVGFHGGTYGFPGGWVKKEDCSEPLLRRCTGRTRMEARRILGSDLSGDLALGHWVTGIRELFEQAGILLCTSRLCSASEPAEPASRKGQQEKRRAPCAGEMGFQALLESEDLLCDGARLAYHSHWLTPEGSPDPYHLRLYLAILPPDQQPLPNPRMVAHSLWLSPDRAMDLCYQGTLPITFATFASLRSLADFDSLETLAVHYPALR